MERDFKLNLASWAPSVHEQLKEQGIEVDPEEFEIFDEAKKAIELLHKALFN